MAGRARSTSLIPPRCRRRDLTATGLVEAEVRPRSVEDSPRGRKLRGMGTERELPPGLPCGGRTADFGGSGPLRPKATSPAARLRDLSTSDRAPLLLEAALYSSPDTPQRCLTGVQAASSPPYLPKLGNHGQAPSPAEEAPAVSPPRSSGYPER
jgi:hypothetical protein